MTVAASANLADTIVLKSGNTFLVSLPDGDVPVGDEHPLGLYRDDCRFLCGPRAADRRRAPRLLVTSAITGTDAVHELTNPELELPDGRPLALQTLQLRVDRALEDETTMLRARPRPPLRPRAGRARARGRARRRLPADARAARPRRASPRGRSCGRARWTGGLRFSARGADGVAARDHGHRRPDARAASSRRPPALPACGSSQGTATDVMLTFDLHQGPADPEPPKPAPAARGAAAAGTVAADGQTRIRTDDRAVQPRCWSARSSTCTCSGPSSTARPTTPPASRGSPPCSGATA